MNINDLVDDALLRVIYSAYQETASYINCRKLQCKGKTRKGQRCKLTATQTSRYCGCHRRYANGKNKEQIVKNLLHFRYVCKTWMKIIDSKSKPELLAMMIHEITKNYILNIVIGQHEPDHRDIVKATKKEICFNLICMAFSYDPLKVDDNEYVGLRLIDKHEKWWRDNYADATSFYYPNDEPKRLTKYMVTDVTAYGSEIHVLRTVYGHNEKPTAIINLKM